MLDDYEFVVFSDASNSKLDKEIKNTCAQHGVIYKRIPQEIHSRPYLPREPGDPLNRPNIRHANIVQYSMDTLGFDYDGPVLVLDSDMFLIRPLSIMQELQNFDIVSAMRGTIGKNGAEILYLWPGFMIFSMDKLPNKRTLNFNCGKAEGGSVDSGGHSYYYLKANPGIKIKTVNEIFGCQLFCPDRFVPDSCIDKNTPPTEQIKKLKDFGFNDSEIKFLQKKPSSIEFLLNNSFLHYRAGTNYDNQSNIHEQEKMKLIMDFLNEILTYVVK